jgi:hypothetical protein
VAGKRKLAGGGQRAIRKGVRVGGGCYDARGFVVHAVLTAQQPEEKQRGNDTGKNAMKHVKRIVLMVLGGTVLAIGVALIVLPGPAFMVIPAGLAILAIEFAWARRWLDKTRGLFRNSTPRNP